MSPARTLPESSFKFGAIVTGIDLNDISDEDVAKLKEAIWRYKVIVVKGQENMQPIKQWELVTRLDPDAPKVHSHGNTKDFEKRGGLLSNGREVVSIPGAPNVRLIAAGYQGDIYGVKDLTVKGLSLDFHASKPSDEEFEKGNTRFQRWHIDAPMYERHPAWFTTLRCIKLPTGPDVTINWDNETGYAMKSKPGRTAFFSNFQLYELLNDEEKKMCDNSWVEYAPHPYMWIENCKANSNGLGLVTQGKEHTLAELPEIDPAKIKKYPFVWINPVTREKALQVHGIIARRLFIKKTPDSEMEIIDDIIKIRERLADLQTRILKPEYIFLAPVEEGDIGMWDNFGMFHTAVPYPTSYGPRTMHQANVGASSSPKSVRPMPVEVAGA
ncbi:MAG: hypothetical protein M1834_005516 [Cirrosporium novae-zelandiae]|nr:MAG: hypothetical protein M1834_005516 [Cirrosporium novae-zelandiae]